MGLGSDPLEPVGSGPFLSLWNKNKPCFQNMGWAVHTVVKTIIYGNYIIMGDSTANQFQHSRDIDNINSKTEGIKSTD